MAEEKSWGKTVKGWFIVDDTNEAPAAGKSPPPAGKAPAAAAKTPPPAADDATDDIIRRYSGGGGGKGKPAAPAAKPGAKPDVAPARSPSGEAPPDFGGGGAAKPAAAGATATAPTVGADGAIDFASVYAKAGITEQETDRVARALALLAQLPKETPVAVKKQIVEAALNSFGVPIESIIESAVAEIEALHASIESGSQSTQTLLSQSQARIEDLQKQIADVQQVMTATQAEQRSLEQQARAQGLKIQQILEFFGEEVVAKVVKDSPRLHEPDAK